MPIGEPFIQLFEVDSTNNYAMAQVQAALAGHGAAWFAYRQTAGKGQRGKAWFSQPGENIILSLIVDPGPLSLQNQFVLSAGVAMACRDFFDDKTGGSTSIKWPNDIYWKDRKAGGILIENIIRGNTWKYAVVGIGININQTSFDTQIARPVSLKQVTGKTFDAVLLAKELCSYIEKKWQQILRNNANQVLDSYQQNMFKLGEKVMFKMGEVTFSATVKGVNREGELLVSTTEDTSIPIGKVEWLLD